MQMTTLFFIVNFIFQQGCIEKLSEYIEDHLLILGAVGLGVSILQVSDYRAIYTSEYKPRLK